MDTNLTSSKRLAYLPTPKTSYGAFGIALTVALAAWVGAASISMAAAETGPAAARAAQTISYSDLDLSTVEGGKTLLSRIHRAASRACGGEPTHSPLWPRALDSYRDCVAGAVDQAVDNIASPMLAALHENTPIPAGATYASR